MAQLIIERVLYSGFEFTLDDGETIFDGFPNMTSYNNICHFKTRNGANIIKNQNITASEVTVRDTYGGTGDFNYTTAANLRLKLLEIKFFDGMGSGGTGGAGVTMFKQLLDAFSYHGNNLKVPMVDEAQQRLIPTIFHNYNKITQHDDVAISSLVENKVLGTKIIDGIEKITLIDKPKDGTTYFSAVGGFDYEDLATKTTPLAYTSGELKLTNDTLGDNTFLTENPYGVPNVWNEEDNTFDFSSLSQGDQVILRVNIDHTTTTANQVSGLKLKFLLNSGFNFYVDIDTSVENKQSGVHNVTKLQDFYVRDAWKNNPVELIYFSDNNSSIVVNGWHPYIIRKSINILDVNDDNYKTFTISNIEADINDVTVNTTYIKLGYDVATSKINKVILDQEYSKYMVKLENLSGTYNFFIQFNNKETGKSLIARIVSYTYLDGYYFLDIEETTDFTDYQIGDKVEVFITPESISQDSIVSSVPKTFNYTSGAQTFTMDYAPNNVDVYVNRTWQYTTAYTLVGDEVTITGTLYSGDVVTIRPFGAARVPETFTATEGQTEFNLSGNYNNVDAHLGRTWQYPNSDYVLTGNLLTLTKPAKAGDILTVRPF